ncbi:MAG TPA: hypothetical protein VGK21_11300 [Candidatus Angelobacter sp.]|jgi:hypothetical protein
MPVKFACKIASATVIISFAWMSSVLWAQSPQTAPRSKNRNSEAFAKAENKWRLAPIDVQSQSDGVTPSLRAVRNSYWQPILQHDRDIEAEGKSMAKPDGLPSVIEIPVQPDATWVVATFDHYLVESIDPNFKLLYTEMSFKINEIIKQSTPLFSPGMSLDVDVEGGSAKTPQGDVISWHVTPRRYFVQPGHTYIMEVRPNQAGQFYYISKAWDVSSGRVVPDHNDEVSRAAEGRSKLNGLPTRDAIAYIQSALASK